MLFNNLLSHSEYKNPAENPRMNWLPIDGSQERVRLHTYYFDME